MNKIPSFVITNEELTNSRNDFNRKEQYLFDLLVPYRWNDRGTIGLHSVRPSICLSAVYVDEDSVHMDANISLRFGA